MDEMRVGHGLKPSDDADTDEDSVGLDLKQWKIVVFLYVVARRRRQW